MISGVDCGNTSLSIVIGRSAECYAYVAADSEAHGLVSDNLFK